VIREFLGKKAAEKIDRSRHGNTKVGNVVTAILDDERLVEMAAAPPSARISTDTFIGSADRIILFALVANLVSWGSVILMPGVVSIIASSLSLVLPKAGALLLVPAFGLTMFLVHATLRRFFPENERKSEQGDVMQSFQTQSESLLTWKLWVISCGVGGVNAICLFVAQMYSSGDWQDYAK